MADELDLIPLPRAASLAHNRVFPGQSVRDMKMLDLLALALSTLVPLYQREGRRTCRGWSGRRTSPPADSRAARHGSNYPTARLCVS
jgi:hypothetical protein